MRPFDPQKVLLNARQATTEDLLDRVTVFRDEMEPEAVEIFETELRRRGLGRDQLEQHAQQRGRTRRDREGRAAKCGFCHRPAVVQGWGWHRLWGRVPVIPRRLNYCEEHRPNP
jgi:hypothetical protein